jgi:hypothetical protein
MGIDMSGLRAGSVESLEADTPSQAPDEAGVVEVTQADRDAAASIIDGWWRNLIPEKTAQIVRDGLVDKDRLVQAFARHRLAALSPPPVVEEAGVLDRVQFLLDRLDELDWSGSLEDIVRDWNGHVDPPLSRLRAFLATSPVVEVDAPPICEACGKPVLRGQFCIAYEDVGEVHANCDDPTATSDDPMAIVLLGSPLRRFIATSVAKRAPTPPAGEEAVERAKALVAAWAFDHVSGDGKKLEGEWLTSLIARVTAALPTRLTIPDDLRRLAAEADPSKGGDDKVDREHAFAVAAAAFIRQALSDQEDSHG